jgi:hypothetical protein
MAVMGKLTPDQVNAVLPMLRNGDGPAHIIETLGLDVTKRAIQKLAISHGVERPHIRNGRLDEDNATPIFQEYVRHCLISHRKLDPNLCAQCGVTGKMDVHHTKYEGATIYDLEFVCRKCNTSPRNVGLA